MTAPLDESQAEIVAVGYFRDLGYDYAFERGAITLPCHQPRPL